MPASSPPVTLHLTNAYHEASGGIRTFYHAALEAANREGRPLRLVVPAARTRIEEVGPCGRIYHVAAPRTPLFDRRYRLLLPHAYALPFRTPLRSILAFERPALVEITDKYTLPWLAGVLRRQWIPGVPRPVIVGYSCERMDDNVSAYVSSSPAARRLAQIYMRHAYMPRFDFHIAASTYVADELYAAALPRLRERIAVRTLGVDVGRFDARLRSRSLREELMEAPDNGAGPALLLYAGRLSREKNAGLLADMMMHLVRTPRPVRLILAGSGPSEAQLRRRLAGIAPGCVRFLPHIADRHRLAALYASCDVFVHPNPREPFGIGPLEAMASGCALVAPHAGGVLTYATGANAWLAAPDGAAFAHAVRGALESPDRERRLAAARATAEDYDWPLVMRRLFAHYDDLRAATDGVRVGRPPADVAPAVHPS